MTDWTRRAHIFVNTAIIAAARTKAQAILPDAAEHLMFDAVRLSPKGTEPVRAYGCDTALKVAYVQRWKTEFIDLNPANVRWYLLDAATAALLATNSTTVQAAGQPWTWEQSLADVGLKVILPPRP